MGRGTNNELIDRWKSSKCRLQQPIVIQRVITVREKAPESLAIKKFGIIAELTTGHVSPVIGTSTGLGIRGLVVDPGD